tara:strand:+ start:1674 stop:1889 length:216 start_codon:yes stop_codon:yes gene_type:complete
MKDNNNIKLKLEEKGEKRKLDEMMYEDIEKEVLGIDKAAEVHFIRRLWIKSCELEDENLRLKEKMYGISKS